MPTLLITYILINKTFKYSGTNIFLHLHPPTKFFPIKTLKMMIVSNDLSKCNSLKPLCIRKSFIVNENNKPRQNEKHLMCVFNVGVRISTPPANDPIENDCNINNNIIIIIYIIHYKCMYVFVRTRRGGS